jgi:multisubunit Na+/H+ antiporter MnhC subunit
VAGAGVSGIAALWIRDWPGKLGGALIALGVLTLAVALVIANAGNAADFPDQIYEHTRPEEGTFVAALGAALVVGGAIGCAMTRRQRGD